MPIDFSATVLKANIGTFGEPVSYTYEFGTTVPVNGIFDEAYTELVVIDGEAVTVKRSVLGIRLSDFPECPKQNDQLIARGKSFIVREVRLDGHGGAKLMLNKIETSPEGM